MNWWKWLIIAALISSLIGYLFVKAGDHPDIYPAQENEIDLSSGTLIHIQKNSEIFAFTDESNYFELAVGRVPIQSIFNEETMRYELRTELSNDVTYEVRTASDGAVTIIFHSPVTAMAAHVSVVSAGVIIGFLAFLGLTVIGLMILMFTDHFM